MGRGDPWLVVRISTTVTWAAMLALLAATTASAQSEGEVRTWVEPAELVLDEPFVWVDGKPERNEYSFTVHIEGEIEGCLIGFGRPYDVFVEAAGTSAISGRNSQGESFQYFSVDTRNFTVPWELDPQQGDRYVISASRVITVTNEAAPPGDVTATIEWSGQQLDPSGTRCRPDGYHWTIDATPHTVIVPSFACDPDSDPDGCSTLGEEGEEGTPVGILVPLVAVALAAAWRRRDLAATTP